MLSPTVISALLLVLMLAATGSCKPNATETPPYTENITEFKGTHIKARMELTTACWILIEEAHSELAHGSPPQIALMKACLQTLPLKEAVVKITSLIGKNMSEPIFLNQLLSEERIGTALTATGEAMSDFDLMLGEITKVLSSKRRD